MIVGLQISAVIFSFVMIYFALIHFKKNTLNKSEFIIWGAIWLIVIFIVLFPDVIRAFAREFLFARLFDMLVAGGFILVIALAAKSYITTKKLEKKLEKLVRKNAIKRFKNK